MSPSSTARPSRFLRWAVLSILVVAALAWCFTRGPGRYGFYYAALRVPHEGAQVWAVESLGAIPDRWSTRLLLHAPVDLNEELGYGARILGTLIPQARLQSAGVEDELISAASSPSESVRLRAAYGMLLAAHRNDPVLSKLVGHADFDRVVNVFLSETYFSVESVSGPFLSSVLDRSDATGDKLRQILHEARTNSDQRVSISSYELLISTVDRHVETDRLLQEMFDHHDDEMFSAALRLATNLTHRFDDPPPKAPDARLSELAAKPKYAKIVENYLRAERLSGSQQRTTE